MRIAILTIRSACCWPARDALDHAPEVVVADRLAMLAHRDDRVVDLREFVGRQHEPELLGAALHGVTARVAAEHELLGVLADVLRPHDFVGPRVLQHAVLVDAGFVREGVAPDDRLVRLHRLVGELARAAGSFRTAAPT